MEPQATDSDLVRATDVFDHGGRKKDEYTPTKSSERSTKKLLVGFEVVISFFGMA